MHSIIPTVSASLMLLVGAPMGLLPCETFAQEGATAQTDVDRIIRTFEEAWWGERPDVEELREIASEAMEDLDIESLSGVDLGRLMTFTQMLAHAQKIPEVRQALEKFRDDPGPDGASAQIHLLSSRLWSADDAEQVQLLRTAMAHPGLEKAMEAGAVHNLFSRFRGARPEPLKECVEELLALSRFLPDHAGQLAFGFPQYHEMLTQAAGDSRATEVEHLRVKMAALATAAAAEHTSERAAKSARDSAMYLDGPFVRGTLIGNPAPAMTILWSSDDSIESLESLKGRVVVVDFWATWCGPCIASFPQIRELAAHYAGYPVTVLGVTSIQGFHIAAPRERIHTGGEPEREFALMAEYIPGKEITWPVVFTEENVFHPGFGVRGIPHVAIIDPAGNVRYNGLHPAQPKGRSLFEKAEKIDALLKEAGLPTPPPPPEPAIDSPAEAAADPDR